LEPHVIEAGIQVSCKHNLKYSCHRCTNGWHKVTVCSCKHRSRIYVILPRGFCCG